MADRALALPTLLVLHEMKYLAVDAPNEVNPENLAVMRRGLGEELKRLNQRYRRLSELHGFFEQVSRPNLDDFRKALRVVFRNMSQGTVDAAFVHCYNMYIKEKEKPCVKYLNDDLFDYLLMTSDEFPDMIEKAELMRNAVIKELRLLVKVEELLEKNVTRVVFFAEVKKFGINLGAYIDV